MLVFKLTSLFRVIIWRRSCCILRSLWPALEYYAFAGLLLILLMVLTLKMIFVARIILLVGAGFGSVD